MKVFSFRRVVTVAVISIFLISLFQFGNQPIVEAQTSTLRYGCEVQSIVSSAVNYMSPERFTIYAEDWGFNTVAFQDVFWGHIEQDYYQPQVYQQSSLDKLHTMVNRAKAVGLDVIINFFIDFGDTTYWDGWATHDYVVHDADYINDDYYYGGDYGESTPPVWKTGGRARLGEFIEDMAEEFSDCIINPNKFPYHMTGADSADYDAWSEVVFPYLLERIRTTSNHEPVVFVPVHQDSNDWNHQDSWYDDPYGVILGLGHVVPWALDGAHSRDTFTQADKDYIDDKLVGAWTFRNNFPNEDIMSIEYGGLSTPQSERPPSQPRLDCLEYSLEAFEDLRAGWAYHTMSWKVGSDTLLNGQPNSDTMIPEPNIFALLQEHRLPAGEPSFNAWNTGFETGDLTDWDSTSGSASVTSTNPYAGSYSANLTSSPSGGNWLSGWDKRVKFTLDHNDFDEVLTNFPVYLKVDASGAGRYNEDVSFIFDEVGSNKKKIAVTTSDAQTECYVDVEYWDYPTSESARLWIKVPSISNITDTTLYFYYDNDHADNTAHVDDSGVGNAINVWDSNYNMVHHMTGASYSALDDATSNNNDVTAENGSPSYNVGGRCAKAVDFESGDTEYLTVDDAATLDGFSTAMTLEAWVKLESISSARPIFGKHNTSANQRAYYLQVYNSTRLEFAFSSAGDKYIIYQFSGATYNTGVWYKIVVMWIADSTPKAYCDGVALTPIQIEKTEPAWTTSTINDSTENLHIGHTAHNNKRMDGRIDEPRLSGEIERSTSWVSASYQVERDETIDWYSEETEGGGQSASITHITAAMSELFMRSFIRLEDLPDTNATAIKVMEFQTMGGTLIASAIVYREDGTYYWAVQVGGENWNEGNRTASTISADTNYGVEFYANATSNGNITLWINEQLKCEDLGDYSSLGEIQKVVLYSQIYGSQSSAKTVYHDDFVVDDERIYGGVTSVFKVSFYIYGDVPLPDVVINGTHQTNEFGYYEWVNLIKNTIYTFIVAKPIGYYPAWILNLEGSFSWNGTHYILLHNVTGEQDYLGLYFYTTSKPFVRQISTNVRLTSCAVNDDTTFGDEYSYTLTGSGWIIIDGAGCNEESYLQGYDILLDGSKTANIAKSYNLTTDRTNITFSSANTLTLYYTKDKTTTISANTWFWLDTYDVYINFTSQHSFTDLYRSGNRWYFSDYGLSVENANMTVTKYFDNEELFFTVTGNSGDMSTSEIYCANLGEPYKLEGVRDWEYDGSSRLVTVHVEHQSSEDVKIYWGATSGGVDAGGLDVLDTSDDNVLLKPSFWSTQWLTIAFLVVIAVVMYVFFGRH